MGNKWGGGEKWGRGEEWGRMEGMKGGAEGDRGWDDLSPDVQHMCPKSSETTQILLIWGGWAVGRGVYCPRNRSSVSSLYSLHTAILNRPLSNAATKEV